MSLVIGIDSSTTATKAIAFDEAGRPHGEGRAPVPMARPVPGAFEQDPEDWWLSAAAALRELGRTVDLGRAAALAIANQRETVGFLDAEGRPVHPGMVWLDERCRPDIDLLGRALGPERIRRITGKAPDLTPAVYKLGWLRRSHPDAFARMAFAVDVHGYLTWRLTGERVTSWASADPHSVFDLEEKRYAPPIMAALGLDERHFFPAKAPGSVLGYVSLAAADLTGLRSGTPVIAGGGDGQAAGLGCAILGGREAYLNLGTATVAGVFSRRFATADAFRTLISMTGDGYVLELVLRSGAFLTDWFLGSLLGEDLRIDPSCYDRLEAEAAAVPIGAGALLLLPYWSGVMSPHWDPDARGVLMGLGGEHRRGHVYRALIEGIALDFARGLETIENVTGEHIDTLVTIGGGARSRLWRQIFADATGKDVQVSTTVEASCLGAAMVAAAGAGWFASIGEASRAMRGADRELQRPDPAAHARYRDLSAIYGELYPALQRSFADLATFREKSQA